MRTLYTDGRLGFEVLYVPRSEWGSTASTETWMRQRFSATKAEKTSYQVHHTAAIDSGDKTPNMWPYGDARAYMRRLQTSRPDLGPLPYNENAAISEDLETVWLFEGRGLLKVGSHTAGYNRSGIALGWFGNFDLATPDRALAIARRVVELRAGDLRHNQGFTRLGDLRNPRGWEVWGHRDSSPKSCPGNRLYPKLADVRFIEKEDEMTPEQEAKLDQVLELLSGVPAAAAGQVHGKTMDDPWFGDAKFSTFVRRIYLQARQAYLTSSKTLRVVEELAKTGGLTEEALQRIVDAVEAEEMELTPEAVADEIDRRARERLEADV